jgi:hypothetical protein
VFFNCYLSKFSPQGILGPTMLQPLLNELHTELEILPVPQVADHLEVTFALRDDISVNMRDLKPGISFFSQIAPCPAPRKEELFVKVSKANYLGQLTGAARIGLSADGKFLTLLAGMPYEMSYRNFREALEDFINFLLYWRSEIEQFERQQSVI